MTGQRRAHPGIWRSALLLLAIAVVACGPRAVLPDWTGTEGRRVQIAAEMVRGGDWLVPTLGGEPTLAKPPLHYWLLAAVQRWSGDGFVAMRAPAVLLVWLLAVLAFALHRRAFGAGAAWVAALGVLCAPVVVYEFVSAEIDPPFACCTAASIWCLAYGVARRRRAVLAAAGVLGGLALLLKGPVYFVFAAGALLVFWRHRRGEAAWVFALPLLVVPALWLVPLLSRVSWDESLGTAGDETVGRLWTYQWRHVLETPVFWLKALLVQMPLLCWCFWEYRSRRDARMGPEDLTLRMCSGAAVLAVALLSLFPGKPTRYLLPNVPLFTFAVAPAVAHYARRSPALGRFARGALRAVGAAGALGLLVVAFLPMPLPARAPAFLLIAGLVPLLVRTPRALVAMCFWLPVAGAWTLIADHRDAWAVGPRAVAPHGPLLRGELEALDALSDLSTFGHVDGGILLAAGLLPPGHEAAQRPPSTRFVLREDPAPPLPDLPGYDERVRICLPGEVFVIEERSQR